MKKLRKIIAFCHTGWSYGRSASDKLKIVYLLLRWRIGSRYRAAFSVLPPVAEFSIVVGDQDVRLVVPRDPVFAHEFFEVFSSQDYEVADVESPEIIFDVGAHFGLAALYFSCLLPKATVYAFEPASESFRLMNTNLEQRMNVIPLNYGLYSRTGTARLYLASRSGENSIVEKQSRYEDIHVKSLDEAMQDLSVSHVDILKIDVEGAEEAIFEATTSLEEIDLIVGELHLDLIDREHVMRTLSPYFDISVRTAYAEVQTEVFVASRRE